MGTTTICRRRPTCGHRWEVTLINDADRSRRHGTPCLSPLLDICLSEFQVYHFGCRFCFIRAHLLLTSHSLFYLSFWAPEATARPAPCCFIRPITSKLTSSTSPLLEINASLITASFRNYTQHARRRYWWMPTAPTLTTRPRASYGPFFASGGPFNILRHQGLYWVPIRLTPRRTVGALLLSERVSFPIYLFA
jgi:hypothetical protein